MNQTNSYEKPELTYGRIDFLTGPDTNYRAIFEPIVLPGARQETVIPRRMYNKIICPGKNMPEYTQLPPAVWNVPIQIPEIMYS